MQFQLGSFIAFLAVAFLLAFALAWFAKTEGAAYVRGLGVGFVVLFGRSCVEMFGQNPVQANRAAEGFFWSLPLLLGWAVFGIIAVGLAREFKRMRARSGQIER